MKKYINGLSGEEEHLALKMLKKEMTEEQKDFLKRLEEFFKWNCSKSEMDDRAMILNQLLEELTNY